MPDCNIFQWCSPCLKLLGKVMILLVLAFVGLSYYAVVVVAYGPILTSATSSPAARVGSFLACAAFTALIAMLLWSYLAAVAADPGGVPLGWHPFSDDHEARAELDRLRTGAYRGLGSQGRPARWCKKCGAWKPERAHHCSMGGRCVLKMDHYCVWVLNTVGLLNYKFFMLFLWYTFLASGLGAALLSSAFVRFLTEDEGIDGGLPVIVFLAFIVDIAFSLSVGGFLVMHVRLVLTNRTTIEMYEKPVQPGAPWPYDRGLRRNFEEVFGSVWWRACLPLYSREERSEMLRAALGARPSQLAVEMDEASSMV